MSFVSNATCELISSANLDRLLEGEHANFHILQYL
jgi:hypothetical protein